MYNRNTQIHSVERAGVLESSFRYRFQNPKKILQPYIKPGMTVLDLGCGSGFFTTEIARLLDGSGKVIAADIQDEMLEMLRLKITGSALEPIIQIRSSFICGIIGKLKPTDVCPVYVPSVASR